jgi:hypothetical protein
MQNTLVLGADLSHPGPGAIQGCPSIAAIFASVDDDGGKFLGSMRLQTLGHSDQLFCFVNLRTSLTLLDLQFSEDMVLERINA